MSASFMYAELNTSSHLQESPETASTFGCAATSEPAEFPSLPDFKVFIVGISTAAILYLPATCYKLLLAAPLKSPIFQNLLYFLW